MAGRTALTPGAAYLTAAYARLAAHQRKRTRAHRPSQLPWERRAAVLRGGCEVVPRGRQCGRYDGHGMPRREPLQRSRVHPGRRGVHQVDPQRGPLGRRERARTVSSHTPRLAVTAASRVPAA